MANHAGGYLLNDLIGRFEKLGVWEQLGREKTHEAFAVIADLGHRYHCITGEIFDGVSDRFGYCMACLTPAADVSDGMCKPCRTRHRGEKSKRVSS